MTAAPVAVPAGPLRRVLLPVTLASEALAMLLLVTATALIVAEAVARTVFEVGLPWADELARYAGLGVIFLGVPVLLARDGHVKVDAFLLMLPGRARRGIALLNELLTLAFCGFFLVACWWFMQRAGRFSTPALAMPNLFYYAPAIAGMSLMTLVAVDRVIGAVLGRTVAVTPDPVG